MTKQTKKPEAEAPEKDTTPDYAGVVESHKFTYLGKEQDGNDVASVALDINTKAADLEGVKSNFGVIFVLLAATCKGPQEFLDLMVSVEAENSFKTKLNPDGANVPPSYWRQYKSDVKVIWEKFDKKPSEFENMNQLKQKLNELRKEAKEAEQKDSEATAEGEAIAQAMESDQTLGNLIGSIANTYDRLSDESQQALILALTDIARDFAEVADLEENIGEPTEAEGKEAAAA